MTVKVTVECTEDNMYNHYFQTLSVQKALVFAVSTILYGLLDVHLQNMDSCFN